MTESHLAIVARELSIAPHSVAATATLLAEGATVPFIARYRKEATGTLDEVQITKIRDRMEQLFELDQRRTSITKSLEERALLTDDLKKKIAAADTLSTLEDIYLPYRPKKRTRAMIARERDLEPLAELLWAQDPATDPRAAAEAFVDAVKEVPTVDDALAGARDILAEKANDDAVARAKMRELYLTSSTLRSKVLMDKETEGAKYKDYFDWSEPAKDCPSHRMLAVRRGEKEGFLICRITPPEEDAIRVLENLFLKRSTPAGEQVRLALHDCYKRLLAFSMEGEARLEFKKRADEEAIRVFAENLRELLLASPLGRKSMLAIDPGFRTGCKVVCLDPQGKLLHTDLIHIEGSGRSLLEAAETMKSLVTRFKIEAIAIGNGTAGRETEAFVRKLGFPPSLAIVMVNESGASIYSASEVAREEFPNHDLTIRGSVSIGRRLMDPLAELVKLDPKSIGVGQYQHDVEQNALKRSLDDTVMSCVNGVGVELNTASKQLLSYVSGLNSRIAGNIVAHRDENGPFMSRQELLKVAALGPKSFEQAAGFLRIREGVQPLDASAVHPEAYPIVDRMAADLGCSVADLLRDANLRQKIRPQNYVTEKVGLPTLTDILAELNKPGRDPRKQFEAFEFTDGVNDMRDLKVGMKLPGIVTNVTAFGAFVDIGVHQDGLVHVSQIADHFVKNPAEAVKVSQKVQVTVMEVDMERKRIALSMRTNPQHVAAGQRTSPGGGEKRGGQAGGRPKPTAGQSAPSQDWFSQAMNRKH